MKELQANKKIHTATPAFIFLSVIYVALLLISNITVVKLIQVGPFLLTAAFFTYPLVYVISDIMTEIYGYRLSMKAIWANFSAQALVALILSLTIRLRGMDESIQNAMSVLFSTTWRIVAGSLTAYWVGDWMNSLIMSKMKVAQKGRRFFIRAMVSSLPAHMIDIALFNTIAFSGVWTSSQIMRNTLSESALASVYELLFFPITLLVVRWWKKIEKIDTYDEGISYRPF
jgi:uncharacterized integral membrane protein (TIGR00697 family)